MRHFSFLAFAVLLVSLAVLPNFDGQARAGGDKRGLKFEVYQDVKMQYRWRLKAANGQVIATSGQGYKAKADCVNAVEIIKQGAATAKVEEAAPPK